MNQHTLEGAVQESVQRWDAFHLMDELRSAGVPAGVALKGADLLNDKALRERHHFWPLHHPEMGTLSYNGPAYRFSKTSSTLMRAAPCLGQDTDMVLADILRMENHQIEDLRGCGVLE